MSGMDQNAGAAFVKATRTTTNEKPKKRNPASPITLRLTPNERAQLEELATGMTLSAYIRACVFAEEERRQKRRPKNIVADKKAMAEALTLLGQSRIANNLNQLAYHANIGALAMDEHTRGQIDEAYLFIAEMRELLIKALRRDT
jgi:hypothetical protein